MFTNHEFDKYATHTFGVFTANEDRDRSRAAAERYFLMASLPERPATQPRNRSGLRRLLAFSASAATQPGRAEA